MIGSDSKAVTSRRADNGVTAEAGEMTTHKRRGEASMVTTATTVSQISNGDDGDRAGSDKGWRAPLQWRRRYFLSPSRACLSLSLSPHVMTFPT
ncbi:uncharacterized protein DS421_9g271500 [Arachis hypogaea]|nr:uncharacterized protein DS421_9g271500 [Arachis hypogaea]